MQISVKILNCQPDKEKPLGVYGGLLDPILGWGSVAGTRWGLLYQDSLCPRDSKRGHAHGHVRQQRRRQRANS